MIRVMLGLVIAAFGVGGVENSVENTDLFLACLVAALGLMIMHSGVRSLKEVE